MPFHYANRQPSPQAAPRRGIDQCADSSPRLPANSPRVPQGSVPATLLDRRDLPAGGRGHPPGRYCWYSWSVLAAMMKSLRCRLRILWVHQVT